MPSGVILDQAGLVDPNNKKVIVTNIDFFIAEDCTYQVASGQGWIILLKLLLIICQIINWP